MSRIKVFVGPNDTTIFSHGYLRPVLNQYFQIVTYEPGQTAVPGSIVIAQANDSHNWYEPLVNSGARLVIDAFWEYHAQAVLQQRYPDAIVAAAKSHFWVNEHFDWSSKRRHSYSPDFSVNRTHRALLPIRQTKPHRRQLLTALKPWLDMILWSAVDQGRYLPNDAPDLPNNQGEFQRWFNPEWYQKTWFSIVSETTTYTKYQLHVTEKTFKPIAFFHPFVVYGQPGTLAYLHELGFETFENLFDESYDANPDQNSRLRQVVDNVIYFLEEARYSELTIQKMAHNNSLFYNRDRVMTLMREEIINPLIEYAETR